MTEEQKLKDKLQRLLEKQLVLLKQEQKIRNAIQRIWNKEGLP